MSPATIADYLFSTIAETTDHDHAHTPGCTFCAHRSGPTAGALARAAVKTDPEWATRASAWLDTIYPGAIIDADYLVAAIGLPAGNANQIGARFSTWAKGGKIRMAGVKTATRRASHGRLVRTWQVTHEL